jgi:hypothetical protein
MFAANDLLEVHRSMLLSGALSYLLHQDVQYAVTAASRVLRALCDGVRGALAINNPRNRDHHRGKPRVNKRTHRAPQSPQGWPRAMKKFINSFDDLGGPTASPASSWRTKTCSR